MIYALGASLIVVVLLLVLLRRAVGQRDAVQQRWAGSEKLLVLSIAPILASALRAVFEDESVSEIFAGENV